MANFVQITGLRTYPARKYSTRTIEQNVPFIPGIRKYICFSYDYHKYTELLNILYEGGEFEQQEKKAEIPTIYSFNKDTLELIIKCSSNKRLTNSFVLTKEVLEDIITAIKEDANETILDNRVRKEAESLGNKTRTTDWRSKKKLEAKTSETISETAPESPKEEKVEEIKQEEKTITTPQINDNNNSNSIIGQSIPEVKQEEVKAKTIWDVKEAKDIVFKVEKIDENNLNEVPLSKKMEIAGYFWPSHEGLIGRLYGINIPNKEGYEEIRKYFGKIFNVAV